MYRYSLSPKLLMIQLLLSFSCASCFIAYDCSHPTTNFTKMSTVDYGNCEFDTDNINSTLVQIQLLQVRDFEKIHVYQCKVEITRLILDCGAFSYAAAVEHGYRSYIHEISKFGCMKMHKHGLFNYNEKVNITNIAPNSTTFHHFNLGKQLTTSGTCKGSEFKDIFGSWADVTVQGSVKITLNDYDASTMKENSIIILNSGVRCKYAMETCIDVTGGNTFWNDLDHSRCTFDKYDTLYKGMATKIMERRSLKYNYLSSVYTINTNDVTFALEGTKENLICGYKLISTEHPKLIVVETLLTGNIDTSTTSDNIEIDMMTYINSKFVFVDRYLRKQMKDLYIDLRRGRCELEQRVISQASSMIKLYPDEYAMSIMKSSGYMAYRAGDVAYIYKCIPVDVQTRPSNSCTHEIPVTYDKQPYFALSKTRILTKQPTSLPCNPIMPILYKIENTWVHIGNTINLVERPNIPSPNVEIQLEFTSPLALSTSGIYPQDYLDKWKVQVMFPIEINAINNYIARSVDGQDIYSYGLSLDHLISDNILDKITDNLWNKLWWGFSIVGNISSGILGIWIVIRVIKLVLDTTIHAIALHGVYGWSIMLICALWDTVTTFLLHLNTAEQVRNVNNSDNNENRFNNNNSYKGDNKPYKDQDFEDPSAPTLDASHKVALYPTNYM